MIWNNPDPGVEGELVKMKLKTTQTVIKVMENVKYKER